MSKPRFEVMHLAVGNSKDWTYKNIAIFEKGEAILTVDYNAANIEIMPMICDLLNKLEGETR